MYGTIVPVGTKVPLKVYHILPTKNRLDLAKRFLKSISDKLPDRHSIHQHRVNHRSFQQFW